MQRLERSQGLLLAYGSFVAFSVLVVLRQIIASPSEPANAILFGFSTLRLAMVIGLFFVSVFYAAIALRATKDQVWAERFLERWFEGKGISRVTGWLGGISFGLGWVGCFLPAYRMGAFGNYWARVQPAMAIVLLASLATLVVLFIVRNKFTIRDLNLTPLKLGLPFFIFCLLVLGGMFYSGFGVTSTEEDFWYGAGVPILVWQLIVAIIGGVIFLRFEPKWQSKHADLLICILLYIFTAFLWAREPLHKSFFFTLSSDPSPGFYPFADAATFDTASQFPLIGEKIFIFNTVFFERPLYLSFLVYLHLLFGQDYEMLMAAQAGLFAILPVLIYLIGRSLDVRSVGFGSAIVAMLRGINSISASNMIDMANPKMILTDFPAAIGIALVILFICKLLQAAERNWHYPVWIGGAVGVTLMLRTNALLLLVFIPFYVFFRFSNQWKQWLVCSGLIFLGGVAITLPWEMRNLALGGQMYGPITTKFQNVIKQRYLPEPPPESSLPRDPELTSMILKHLQPISIMYGATAAIQNRQVCDGAFCFSSNHFLHNALTSLLILPTSPALDDLSHLIRDRNPYYWKAEWDGTFEGTAPLFLILNLFFLASGITLAWKKKQLAGIAPLAVFVAYNISNGLARTSGGRYIVPIDWILPFYYLFGVFYIITWAANITGAKWDVFSKTFEQGIPNHNGTSQLAKALLVFAVLLGVGGLMPLSENLRQPRYQNMDPMGTLEINRPRIEDAGLKFDDLGNFLQGTNARVFIGRALYPRYYKMNQGHATFAFYPYVTMGFPRMAFKVVGPTGELSVVLPGGDVPYLPHASDVLVLGCKGRDYFDALAVIVLDDNGAIYTRKPGSKLQCPLQQPVCNNNSVCR